MTTVYCHSTPEVCKELAEKRSFRYSYDFTILGYVYRFIDWRDANGEAQLGLVAYPIKSITPNGVVIPYPNKRGWRFISDHMMSRAYAHKTVKLALESYQARKKYHIVYLENQLTRVKLLHKMSLNKPETFLNYENAEEFELPELIE